MASTAVFSARGRAAVFVYGTLKQGFYNHYYLQVRPPLASPRTFSRSLPRSIPIPTPPSTEACPACDEWL